MTNELRRILELIESKGVTAYEISKNTSLTEAGIGKILSGKTKRPQKSTIDILINYLEDYPNTKQVKPSVIVDNHYNKRFIEKDGVKFTLKEAVILVADNVEEAKKHDIFYNLIKIQALEIVNDCITEEGKFDLKKFVELSK